MRVKAEERGGGGDTRIVVMCKGHGSRLADLVAKYWRRVYVP